MKGTLILLAAGIINRILGFVPRIALPRVIGAEGVGLYQMGYPFLIVILTLTTGGIPLAVAKLVAEAESEGKEARVRHVLMMSLALTSGLSLLFTAFCLAAAPWMTSVLFTDKRVYWTFLCMSPIIPIVGVSSVFRGYFQGRQNMIPTAVSQVTETLIRIVAMLGLSLLLMPYGLEYAAAGAMLGVLIGEIGGMLVLLLEHARTRKAYKLFKRATIGSGSSFGGRKDALRRLIRLSVPVTASRLVGSASYFLESILIVQSLAIAGVATVAATVQYGALQGMIIPILLLPSALTFSLSTSLVPSLSEAAARKDMRTIHSRLHQSLRLALVTGAPFAVFMYVLAEPICYYLYKNGEIGVMLKMMAPAALFIYFQAPLQAALQALNRPGAALVNTLIGSVVKLALIALLATKPQFGILGAVMAIIVNIMLVTLLHWNSVARLLKFRMQVSDFLKVGSAMGITAVCCWFIGFAGTTETSFSRLILSLSTGLLVYLGAILGFKLIEPGDFKRLTLLFHKKR
ncbi:stage V sporulation protein B [Paenibacillus aurantius]|uniref:Stage V sporulation protein B n=1 Tax=Paenibacillus aurantius TaxID=2918900 RepID=A0AA96RI92_9BACL|nr:stage V sporulation protein B [Paenibacillus aurantius]WNQ14188.1 stage V sporulation protein B [Paenibacillus aurantius]